MNTDTTLISLKRAEVLLHETTHYIERKVERKFDSSILGRVVPRLCNLKIGQVAKFTDGEVVVICSRTTSSDAVLITGYKKGQAISEEETKWVESATMAFGWR